MKLFSLLSLMFLSVITYGQCQSGDCSNGFGVYFETNGNVYRGNFLNGKYHGYGDLYFSGGDLYKGDFKYGLFDGNAIYFFSNGDIENATWEAGKKLKQNSYEYGAYKKGGCVSGNCQNGYGKYIYSNGTYEGNFSNGQWLKGKHTAANGDVYEGDYNGFVRSGYGVYNWASGKKYEGNWVGGKAEGQGTYYYLDGSRYTGNFVNYSRNGYGVYYYIDGSTYSGNWKEGQRNGNGRMEYPSGTVEDGLFENGKFLGTATQKTTVNSTVNSSTTKTTVQTSSTPVQNCGYKFIKPTNLTYKYLDNRKNCCYCRERYAQYELSTNMVNYEQAMYIAEKLYLHHQESGADEAHRKADNARLVEFLTTTYPGFENMGVIMAAGIAPAMFPLYSLSGKKLGLTVREIDKYKLVSDFCSPRCKDGCSYSSSCPCD